MELKRTYKIKELNFAPFKLVLEEIENKGYKIKDQQRYDQTFGYEEIATDRLGDFLRISEERGHTLDFLISIRFEGKGYIHGELILLSIPLADRLSIKCSMDNHSDLVDTLNYIEKIFDLEQYREEIPTKEKERTIFLAHGFDDRSKSYAYAVVKFLELLGFKVITGERFTPERVSTKVKERLKKQEVVMTIWSEKEDFTWLVQETSGATFLEKPLIVLVEEGLEFKPGVLGDIEYIKFPKDHISESFISIMEGLTELGYSFR